MSRLQAVRRDAQRILLVGLGLSVPVYLAASLLAAPGTALVGTVIVALAAGLVFFSWRAAPDAASTRMITGAAMMALPAALTFMMSGKAWQIDMHMTFFAALAAVTILCDWRALLAAAGAAAVHHLVLNFALPAAVFPGGGDFFRVVFHAVVVVAQTGLLLWLASAITKALETADNALAEADESRRTSETLAEQDRRKEADMRRARADIAALAGAFEKTVGEVLSELERAAAEQTDLAGRLKTDAGGTRERAAAVAKNADGTRACVEAVASAAAELAASIEEVSRTLGAADEATGRAADEAGRAGQSVQALNTAAREIETIADLVTSIAEQTNLLALNATIEAARAGEAGKGFAVVASEVKDLADQTGRATSDIRTRIDAMRRAAEEAAQGLGRIGGVIKEARGASADARGAFGQQASATDEIARLASEAAQSTGQMGEQAGEVDGAAARTDAAAERFESSAQGLAAAASRLSAELAKFRSDLDKAA
ncbi:MAG: methyl-accepting chemotaxis protein [Oceanicaulis sp.]